MKKQTLKFTVLGGLLLSTLMMSVTASAACYQSSQKVARVLSYGTYGYIYMKPYSANLTNSYYYYIRTTSDKILAAASAAKASNSIVAAYGTATTCPTTGTARYMGTATYFYDLY